MPVILPKTIHRDGQPGYKSICLVFIGAKSQRKSAGFYDMARDAWQNCSDEIIWPLGHLIRLKFMPIYLTYDCSPPETAESLRRATKLCFCT